MSQMLETLSEPINWATINPEEFANNIMGEISTSSGYLEGRYTNPHSRDEILPELFGQLPQSAITWKDSYFLTSISRPGLNPADISVIISEQIQNSCDLTIQDANAIKTIRAILVSNDYFKLINGDLIEQFHKRMLTKDISPIRMQLIAKLKNHAKALLPAHREAILGNFWERAEQLAFLDATFFPDYDHRLSYLRNMEQIIESTSPDSPFSTTERDTLVAVLPNIGEPHTNSMYPRRGSIVFTETDIQNLLTLIEANTQNKH